jgi:hypothetical protein
MFAAKLGTSTGIENFENQVNFVVYPNPNDGNITLWFDLKELTEIRLVIFDGNGKIFENSILPDLNPGRNSVIRNLKDFSDGSAYFITLETPIEKATQKIIIEQ